MSTTKDIHNELIERCKRGDVKAQYSIFKKYSQAMYNISIRFMGNSMDAEDVLQEAFVQAFQKLNTFRGESSFGSWLKRIVVNRCISQLRKKKIHFEELNESTLNIEGEAEIEENMDPDRVHKAIKELPEGARTIINLFALEGYKHKEIARILNITESTSKTQYFRAKQMIAEKLNE
jgi:RNA polymerase sigma-70 factor (ECF subfamily)